MIYFRPVGSNKAMKLGTKAKDVDSFVDKLRSEGTGRFKLYYTVYIVVFIVKCIYNCAV